MGIDTTAKKVQINKLVRSQLPSFVAEDNPQFVDFLKQYYVSQEYQGGPIDIATNFNEYQKVDTFNEGSELVGFTTCTNDINSYDSTIVVSSTEGWPADYGLLKIDDEIITYTSKTETSFVGCVRGFCGVDSLHEPTNTENLVFSESNAVKHEGLSKVTNLSNLFLQEFWKKTKNLFLPGFEDRELHKKVDKANFLRQAKDFYGSKGTDEAIKILFGVLFNDQAEVIKPIDYLFAPSDADYVKTFDLVAEVISGNPDNVVGQTLFQTDKTATSGSIFNVQFLPKDDKNYYLISLSRGSVVGEFEATGASKLVDNVAYNSNTGVGATVLTVDSTLGFPDKGTVYVGAGLTVGIATYSSKTSTQFYGVTGISSSYTDGDFVRSSRTVYAYEDGNIEKPVYFRLTNVVTGANIDDIAHTHTEDIVYPRQLGLVSDPNIHQLNSWIHNVKIKTDVATYLQGTTTLSNVDDSTYSGEVNTSTPHELQIGDDVIIYDILRSAVGTPSNVTGKVDSIPSETKFTITNKTGTLDQTKTYQVGRKLRYASSLNDRLNVSNFVANVQNTYISDDNKTAYVTTGSLPGYEISADHRSQTFNGFSAVSNDTINIPNHDFKTGELIRYNPSEGDVAVSGLSTGFAYAIIKEDVNNIKLSRSVLDAAAKKHININSTASSTTHTIVPEELSGKNLKHQNFIREFPITPEVKVDTRDIKNEPIGMLVNGVEIFSNQSGDNVFYGPIEHIDVERGGDDYDVIQPPNIHISDNVGTGATAYAVIEGSFRGIEVISGGYDIKNVPNISITGGNGNGATAYPRLKAIRNARTFDAKVDVTVNTQATASVSISGGVIQNSVNIVNAGTGYITAPTVTVSTTNPHTGADAQLTATINANGQVSGITVVSGGSGYVSGQVTLTLSGPAGLITFADDHLFFDGEEVVYEKSKDNAQIPGLIDKSVYYVHNISGNSKQIALMNTFENAVSGTNAVTITNKSIGTHKIQSTTFRNVIDKIVVENSGFGYSNRKVLINSDAHPAVDYANRANIRSGVSIANNYIFHKNHGFRNGDLVEYSHTGTAISGLSTTIKYLIIKLDEDRFRLCSAGDDYINNLYSEEFGTTSTTVNYSKGLYVDINSVGAGTHTFKYPDISVSMDVISGVGNTAVSFPVIRPICRGGITDIHLTNTGVGYGSSDTINAHRRPLVTISNGLGGLVDVSITDGLISDAFTKIDGKGYVSPPDLIVEGQGKYGKLVSNVNADGTLGAVNIIDSGKDYTTIPDTTVRVKSPGVGAVFRADLRKWNMTTIARYQESINPSDDGIILPSQNPEYESKFTSAYLPRRLRLLLDDSIETNFDEKNVVEHSPIVGWAYDGCPIYGPYGFNSPTGGAVRRLTSGYTAVTRSNRPTEFPAESFVEDFDYTGNGDLDENNGRFGKTPEYPNGVYAYFCTISDTDGSISPFNGTRKPVFPFILNGYQFNRVDSNVQALSLQSTSKLNSGNIIRNTLPYRLGFIGSNYDYLVSSNIDDTEFTIRNTNMTGITSISVHEPGVDYKVGDRLKFDNNNTGGGHGVSAKVKTISGKGIVDITYAKTTVEHIEFNYKNGLGVGIGSTAHGLHDGDLVNVSGIGTGELRFLEGHKTIGVSSVTSKLSVGISSIAGHADSTGRTAFMYLTQQTSSRNSNEDDIQVGDWLIIGDADDSIKEKVQVIEYNQKFDRYKIRRQTGIGNTWFEAGTSVVVDQKKFTFNAGIATDLRIGDNYTITINPQSSIGIGTVIKTETGPYGNVSVARVVAKDNTVLYDRDPQNRPHNTQPGSNCDNSITFENHGFITGQKLQYFKSPTATAGLQVSQNVGMGASFSLTDGQFVYAVKKTDDLFGIQTSRVGIGSTSKSLYFATIGATGGNVTVYDDHQLKTTNESHVGFVDKFDVTVVTSQPHGLKNNDEVTISISPDQTINKSVEYDTVARKTIVEPLYFQSSDVSTSNNTIKITNHGYKDGDKVLYKAGATAITPLEDRDEYYVQRISDDYFKLFTNRKDSISDPNGFINLTNIGSSAGAGNHHRISRINPPIKALLGETVGFAVSDSSNSNFTLEFFRDKNFTNRFDGVGISTEVVRSGVPGTTGSLVSLKLTNNVPLPLWYKLTPSIKNNAGDYIDVTKRDSYPDTQVINGSRISLELSRYSGNFGIKTTGMGNTAFSYQIAEKPEKERYNTAGVSTFRYLTKSTNAKGGINEIKIDFPGREYVRNPGITSIRSTNGKDADVRILDDNVGFPAFTEVTKIGYDYPTDKTLSPRADTYANVSVVNNYVIGHIGIVTAGKNYSTAPDLFLPDRPFAKTRVYLEGTSIGSVEILEDSLTGFSNVPNPPRIIAINNTNGVGVVTARCIEANGDPNTSPLIEIKKPFGGWRAENHRLGTNFPFEVGDQVFVENVEVFQNDNPIFYNEGRVIGYNSDMYDYQYFTITERNIANSWIKYSIAGIGTWGGTFDPVNSAGRVIKKEDLPSFNVRFDHRDFIEGEHVTFGGGSAEGVIVMNEGWDRATNSFRLRGLTRNPFKGDVIVGGISNAQGKVIKSSYYERYFTISHQSDRVKGFQKNTGKLNNDFQKIQDSDYYQNFSYSIQSEVQEKDFSDAVDSIVHPTGYKNFSDLVIKSLPTSGSGRSTDLSPRPPQSDTGLQVSIDNIQSFYVKNDYDFATETTIASGYSKFITFQNKKLTDLLSISSAKVNLIDDLSNQFDGKTETFSGIHKFVRDEIRTAGAGSTGAINIITGAPVGSNGTIIVTNGTTYEPTTGVLTIKADAHGLSNGATVSILDNSLTFTCDKDNHTTEHRYPRTSDPASTSNSKFNWGVLTVANKTTNTFELTINTPVIGGKVVGLSTFVLTTENGGNNVFHNIIDPSNTDTIAIGKSVFTAINHGLQTGEAITYVPGSNTSIGINPTAFRVATTDITIGTEQIEIIGHGLSTADTLTYTAGSTAIGGLTNSTTYSVIRVNNNTIKLATNTSNANGGTAINLTSVGAGIHVFTTASNPTMPTSAYVFKTSDNSFKVIRDPLTPVDYAYTLRNVGTGTYHAFNPTSPESRTLIEIDGVIQSPLYKKAISVAFASNVSNSATSVTLAGITSIRANDIISVGNELMRIKGIGIGGANVCTVERGFLGTSAAAHTTSSTCTIKDGDFNIVNGILHLTTPPYGPSGSAGISTSSTFHGRIFNRKDVTRNFIFDDVSHKFTGNVATGRTFTLTQNDEDVTGIVTTVSGTGGAGQVINNGIILINNIFQRPDIDYVMTPRSYDPNVGIGGSISFTGITTNYTIPRGGKVEDFDVNFGKGYQPRRAAAATAVINAAGSIQSLTMTGAGRGYFSGSVNVEVFNPLGVGSAAVLQATVGTGNSAGMITGITTISGGTGYSSSDPAYNTHVPVVSTDGTTLTINVGTALPKGRYQHSFVRDSGTHTFVSGVTNAITASNGASGNFTAASGTTYNPLTGNLVLTIGSHSLTTSNKVTLADGAVTFTCDADNHATNHSYPRSSDPASGQALTITAKTGTTITVNVGAVKGANSVVTDTTAVAGSGSTAAFTPSTAVYDPNSGDLVLTKASGTWTHATNAGTLTPISGTAYNPSTGILTVKATGHGLVNNDLINILEGGIPLTCAKDSNATTHYYPRKTDPIFGKWIKITKVDNDTFTVWVGGSTYTGAHTFVTGQSANKIRKATSYVRLNDNSFVFTCTKDGNSTQHSYPRTGITVPPIIKVGIATGYSDLVFTGGTGQGFKASVVVGSGGTVIDYDITDRGYGYKNGEVLTVQGIPFEPGISTSSLTFTINKTITDKFAGFSFGQLVTLDNFADQFDNDTKSFLLTKLNVNTGVKDIVTIVSLDTSIDADNNLLIFLNDVLQKPGENYSLEGGTTLNFVEAPKEGSKLQVLFYRGGNADIEALNPVKTFKVGDKVQLLRGGDRPRQSDRVVSDISDVSKIETPLYGGGGISTNSSLVRVAAWKKQESDLVVDGLPISKERSNYTGKFRPVSNIIQNVATNSGTIYLDSGWPIFSAYDNRTNNDKVPGLVELMNVNDVTTARGTVGVSSGGVVNSITVTDFGSGYGSAPTISISSKVTQTPEIGASWTKSTPLTDVNFKGVDYTPEGIFVAVGSTSGIHTSTDGKTWTSSASVTASTWNGVVGMSTATVVVGAAGTIGISTNAASSFTATRIYRKTQTGFIPSYTDENISQSLRAAAIGVVPISTIVGNQLVTENKERAVVVGAAGTILYSEPGQSGIATSFVVANKYANQQFNGIAYRSPYVKESGDAVGPAFIAVGNNGAIYKSTNGEVWSGITTTTITTNINAIEYADDQWIAVGAGGKVFRSTKEQDGSAWQVVGSGTTFALWSLSYQDNVWYAGGGNGMGLNSVNGFEWYKKHMISSDETPVGVVINGLAYGDNKLVAVGVSSNIHYSQFEVTKATATTTVSAAGTVTGATITNAGFGYDSTNPPNILFSTQTVTRERITNCEIKGDYGTVVSVAKQTSGVNSRPTLILGLDASPFINQTAFGNKSASQLVVGDYFVLKGTRFGPSGGLTATDGSGNTIGVGDAYADGIYKVEAVSSSGGVLTVSTNVSSVANVTAVSGGNVGIARSMSTNLGEYSWSKLYNFTRSSTPSAFTVNTNNGYSGISTGPTVSRVSPIALEYSDLSSNS